jgi:hypothetical protein
MLSRKFSHYNKRRNKFDVLLFGNDHSPST